MDDVLRLLLRKNITHTRDLLKLALACVEMEGLFSNNNGTYFDSTILLHIPPITFIRNLLSSSYLSLFDYIFLIGYYNDNDATKIISHSVDIAATTILNLNIIPRDPKTYLQFHKSTKKRLFTGDIVFPDLSWLFTFDEAEKWTVDSFAVSLKEMRDVFAESEDKTNTTNQLKPDYLNKNHPMFSRELLIAIEAWQQVLSSNPRKPNKGSRKSLILAWLDKNHKELSAQAKERIATMINPDSNGGSPKTPEL